MFWRELGCRAVGQQSSDGGADKGMKRIPDQVECRNFIGEEFDGKQGCATRDYGPALQKLESGGQREVREACQKSEDGYCCVEVQSSSESDRDQECKKLSRRNFQDVQHRKRHRVILRRF